MFDCFLVLPRIVEAFSYVQGSMWKLVGDVLALHKKRKSLRIFVLLEKSLGHIVAERDIVGLVLERLGK